MLANDVIDFELRRLIKLTAQLTVQVSDLTSRLERVEKAQAPVPEPEDFALTPGALIPTTPQ